MIRKPAMIAAVLALVPVSLAAQLPQSASERIEAVQARVAQAAIPVELIDQKVAEGRAKGVSEERIATGAERRADALLRARAATAEAGRDVTTAELAVGADALQEGVDASSLRAVIEQARAEEGPVALAVLTELVRQGYSNPKALEAVQNALSHSGDALAKLPEQAAQARARRGRPDGVGRPFGAGAGATAGPPAGVPAPGERPSGRPTGTPGRPGGY